MTHQSNSLCYSQSVNGEQNVIINSPQDKQCFRYSERGSKLVTEFNIKDFEKNIENIDKSELRKPKEGEKEWLDPQSARNIKTKNCSIFTPETPHQGDLVEK